MTSDAPILPLADPASIASHPAVLAYAQITGTTTLPVDVATLKPPHRKSAVYRLSGLEAFPSVVAKRTSLASVRYERAVYTRVLEKLPIRMPRLLGWAEDGDDHGWLLLEDVGDRELDFARREDRELAGAWLARVHAKARVPRYAPRLSSRSHDYYRAILASTRRELLDGREHTRVNEHHRDLLTRVASWLDRLESAWPVLQNASRILSPTLVHGDFVSKNVRIQRREDHGEDVLPVDWEIAGFGSPVADLEHVDLEAYLSEAGPPTLTLDALRAASQTGRAFRLIMEISWAARSLRTAWPDRVLYRYLPTYETWLRDVVVWAEGS